MSTSTTTTTSFRSVWRLRRWRWLLGSTVVSTAGDFLYWVALVVFLTNQDEPALWLSVSFLARLLPWIILGPVGGAIADRAARHRVLIGLDLARAGLFTALAIVVTLDGPPLLVVAFLAVISSCSAIHRPAMVASIPQVVPESDLPAANAADQGLAQLAWFVGPALGAVLVAAFDPGVVLLIDAATFVVSAVLIARAGHLGGGHSDATDERSSLLTDIRQGAVTIGRDRGLRALTIVCTAASLAFGAEQVLYVLVASDRLGIGAEGIGYLLAAMGVGGILAAPLSARLGDPARIGWWLTGTGVVAALALAAISLTDSLAVVLAVSVIEGAAAVIFEVVSLTLTQRGVEERYLGRVASVLDSVATLGQTVGSLAAPLLVATVGLRTALQVSGVAAAVVIALSLPALLTLVGRSAQRGADPAIVALLAATRELAPLPALELERLAGASRSVTLPAGTRVMSVGDRPDDAYVVRAGTLHVTTPDIGTPIPDLGPGDLFGELGLLHGRPRTADVTAATDVDLVVLDGTVFTAVLLPVADGATPLAIGMRTRLGRTHQRPVAAGLVPASSAA